MVLQWSAADHGYIALVPELPGLSAFGESAEVAATEACAAADLFVEVLAERNEPVPEPRLLEEASGQLRLRMPKSLHAALAIRAQLEGESLNSLIVHTLQTALACSDIAEVASREIASVANAAVQAVSEAQRAAQPGVVAKNGPGALHIARTDGPEVPGAYTGSATSALH